MKTVVYLFAAATVSLVLASLVGCAVLDRILLEPVLTTNHVERVTIYTNEKT